MEVSPGVAREKDMFLHFIQVGDLSMSEMAPAELVQEDGLVGVSFRMEGNETTITFSTEGKASGHIRMMMDEQTVVDKAL